MDQFVLLVWHAFLIAIFFTFLWRQEAGERRRFFVKAFLIMVLGAVALGWIMFPVP